MSCHSLWDICPICGHLGPHISTSSEPSQSRNVGHFGPSDAFGRFEHCERAGLRSLFAYTVSVVLQPLPELTFARVLTSTRLARSGHDTGGQ